MATLNTITLNTSTATKIAIASSRSRRAWVRIQNDGPGDVRIGIGVANITASRGDLLGEGLGAYISNEDHAAPATEAIWAIGVTGAAVVHITEGGSR